METLTLPDNKSGQVLQEGSTPPFEDHSSTLCQAAIARGRELAADSSYPPFAVCEKIAAVLVTGNDRTASHGRLSPDLFRSRN